LVAALASTRHAGLPTAFTEPVIGPVRRVLKPVRLGSVSVDLAFTAVFIAVVVLRTVVVPLIPF
jgi:YggT family protein